VRPRPCGDAHRRSGRPGFPSALTMRGCLDGWTRFSAEGSAKPLWISVGFSSRVRHRKRASRGVEDPSVGAPERVPARHEGAFYEGPDQDVATNGASAPYASEGQRQRNWRPRAHQNMRCEESRLLRCLKIDNCI